MTIRTTPRRAAVTALLALGGLVAAAAPSPAAPAPTPGPAAASSVLLLLDASGSMKRPDPSGLTKVEAAKKALTGVVRRLPEETRVGLRVYGARVDGGGKPTKAACADTRLEVPVGPLDRVALTTAVGRVRAVGETPIALSLEQALDDLGPTGKRTVVLVSDGEESCVPDPCPVVRRLVGAGIDLRIDTVGFGVGAAARRQLQCIARAGNGTYYDAADADQLTADLARISVRAARAFTVSGTRVTGTPAPSGAPDLTAGQYVDTFTTGAGARHYTLRRTVPGSTLHVSVSARPAVDLDGGGYNAEDLRFRATAPDGTSCTNLPGRAERLGLSSLAYVVADSIALDGGHSEGCGTAVSLDLEVDRVAGGKDPVDAELLVLEEPPVDGADALPDPAPVPTPEPARSDGTPQEVVGGTTFSDATPLSDGTFTETFVGGETIFYRFPVDWGQGVRLTVDSVRPVGGGSASGPLYDVRLYDPTRGNVRSGSDPLQPVGAEDRPAVRELAPVRYRNREELATRFASLAGQYYAAVSVPSLDDSAAVPMRVTFTLETTGEPAGAPRYRAAAAAPSVGASSPAATTPAAAAPSRPDRATDAGRGWVAWGVGAALLLVAGAAALVARARRRA
ncbi:vWA domain-containing protein [Phycicoccus avicenniae]|uniref:vWA domain-containing protein n=1 Tax=Phycicoccus avicenniae TaxID=2828860 RepID=UPI003D2887B7